MTGALLAIRRHYDVIGVFVLALVSGGGGLLLCLSNARHCLQLQNSLRVGHITGAIVSCEVRLQVRACTQNKILESSAPCSLHGLHGSLQFVDFRRAHWRH